MGNLFKKLKSSAGGGVIIMLIATLFFAFKPILGRIVMEEGVTPEQLVTIRLMIALPFFILTLLLSGCLPAMKMGGKDFGAILLVSIFGMAGAMIFSFKAIMFLGASISTIVVFVFPTITTIFAYFFLKEKITAVKVVSLCISFFGIVLVVLPLASMKVDIAFFNPYRGLVFAFLSAICWAGTQVSMQELTKKHSAVVITTWSTLIMLAFFITIYGLPDFNISTKAIVALFLLGTVCWFLPYLLAMQAIKIIGASSSAIVQSSGPGLTVIISWLILGES